MEYFVTKLSFREEERLIKDAFVYEYDGRALSEGRERQRHWMVNRTEEGSTISSLTRSEVGGWLRGYPFTYRNGLYSWEKEIPQNTPMRKTFVSYYHFDDQGYRTRVENLFGDLVLSKSVESGDIDSDNSDEYIKQLIQKKYLSDTTVLVVLIGPNTRFRKHVVWEIAGALNYKVGDGYAGVLGLFLPSHPNSGSDKYTFSLVPRRLAENFKSGYAIARDWTDDRVVMQGYVEEAFGKRSDADRIVNSEIPQMIEDGDV